MLMFGNLNGPGGLGQFNSDPAFVNCPPNTWFDSAYSGQCIPFGAQAAPTQQVTQSTGVPWWKDIVGTVVEGSVRGLTQDKAATAPVMPIVAAAPPWYTTPIGMLGIGGAVIALFFLLKK
jgi:hypothetical protein